jgi:hypothetical protein
VNLWVLLEELPRLRKVTVEQPSLARARDRGHDELLMNSLKAAVVWGNAGIAQLVKAADL